MSKSADLVIAGIGNRYRCDDAVGLHLVEGWQASVDVSVGTELWEDLDGAGVAHRLVELACPLLLVDCAELGLPGGAYRLLAGREIEKMQSRSVVSTHGIGLAQGIQLAGALGHARPLWVFGVQPFAVGMGGELSADMAAVLPELRKGLALAVSELLQLRVAG